MYLPPQFQPRDADAVARTVLREHPFASLISTDDTGLPFVTHLPFHLEERGDALVLLGHCAKPNPHWRYLQARPRAVATFLGPHAYQSPSIYADLQRVPSWNYVAVHCTVEATLLEGDVAKDRLLKHLIGDHEPAYAAQWRALDPDFQHKLMQGIVAFELAVTGLQCKVKLNQHRPESHASLHAGYAAGDPGAQGLARWMERLGLAGALPAAPASA